MKKIVTLIIASSIGGVLTLGSYLAFIQKEAKPITQYQTYDTNLVQQTRSSYTTNLDFTQAAKKTVDAVVHVKVRTQMSGYENPLYNFLFGKPNYPSDYIPIVSAGSGVIISTDGYIVTNNHVIDGADILEITLNDKRTFTAKVIGADPTTDIALIKIDGSDMPFIEWGDSDELQIGEWVLAVGNPFNLASTVTAGIVSAKSRNINIFNKSTSIEAFIQTDAAVNPGNSGGALVDTKGRLIGINTAIASPTGTFSGYSFAVPERIAKKVVYDLIQYGTVQRAFIGVSINDVTSPIAKKEGVESTKGVYVSAVTEDGAAKAAGVKAGDIILEVKNVVVNSTAELQEQIGQLRPGDEISVKILRGSHTKNLLLTLRNIEGNEEMVKPDEVFKLHGASFKSLNSNEASKLRVKGGVKITALEEGKFLSSGIKEGFVITSINRRSVYDIQDLKLILKNLDGGIYIEGVYPNGISAYYAFGI
ncbi:MAG: Do family serine endopeptidase [Salinivirgaceae bacterium]|nr:Do family serine endopeptidase [Salinivirgaceae bacterium]